VSRVSDSAGVSVLSEQNPVFAVHLLGLQQKAGEDHPCTVPHARFFGWLLTDDEVACVLSYIRNAWGNSTPAVNAGTVGKARKKLQECSD
jgi:hypothetical protein